LKLALETRGEFENGVPNIVHGTHFILVDQKGQLRGYYDSDDPDRLRALETDLRQLVR
jgi:protein SCO1/2